MLLRRVIVHVREQNWTAVGIDFVIVVVGVFIGIQVANWNDERSNRALERVLVESLQRDFRQILLNDSERYERTVAAPEALGGLIDAIRACQEPERDVVWPGLEAALLVYATTPGSSTYGELLSTGRLSRLTNQALRQRLAEFERSRSGESGLAEYLVEMSYGSPLYRHVDLHTADSGLGLVGSYRWDGLSDVLPQLQERLIYLHALANWRRSSHANAKAILEIIEEELK
jgi:hypothetical protein